MSSPQAEIDALREAAHESAKALLTERGTVVGFRLFAVVPARVHLRVALSEITARWPQMSTAATYTPWASACFATIDMMIRHPPLRNGQEHPWSNRPDTKNRRRHGLDAPLSYLWAAASSNQVPVTCAQGSATALQAMFVAEYLGTHGESKVTPERIRTTVGAGWLAVADAVELALGSEWKP